MAAFIQARVYSAEKRLRHLEKQTKVIAEKIANPTPSVPILDHDTINCGCAGADQALVHDVWIVDIGTKVTLAGFELKIPFLPILKKVSTTLYNQYAIDGRTPTFGIVQTNIKIGTTGQVVTGGMTVAKVVMDSGFEYYDIGTPLTIKDGEVALYALDPTDTGRARVPYFYLMERVYQGVEIALVRFASGSTVTDGLTYPCIITQAAPVTAGNYYCDVYPNGRDSTDGILHDETLRICQIKSTASIPVGTWVMGTKFGEVYYGQVPVWLGV